MQQVPWRMIGYGYRAVLLWQRAHFDICGIESRLHSSCLWLLMPIEKSWHFGPDWWHNTYHGVGAVENAQHQENEPSPSVHFEPDGHMIRLVRTGLRIGTGLFPDLIRTETHIRRLFIAHRSAQTRCRTSLRCDELSCFLLLLPK